MAMADLAQNGRAGKAVTLQDIAERQQISLSYLEQLFARLRRAGLVLGTRGPGGGYRLARTPADMAVAEIILAVNEPIKATRCKEGSGRGCTGGDARCIAHDLWEELGRQIHGFLAAVSLEDVVEQRVGRRPIAAE
jgi:Rrf2 family iron-sulfur cluster assembly transcriptional regulator